MRRSQPTGVFSEQIRAPLIARTADINTLFTRRLPLIENMKICSGPTNFPTGEKVPGRLRPQVQLSSFPSKGVRKLTGANWRRPSQDRHSKLRV